jgi:hypothetical protein
MLTKPRRPRGIQPPAKTGRAWRSDSKATQQGKVYVNMKKSKSALLIERAVQLEELGPIIPRRVAAKFGCMSPRTLKNHEYPRGPLNPIRRNSRSVSYLKTELLAFLGLTEPDAASKPAN